MKNIIQDLPCVEVGAGHGLITREPTTWGMLPTMRHGVIAKRLTSTLHQSAARAWNAKRISSSMNCPSGTNGSSRWTQSSPCYRKNHSAKTKHHPPERPAKRGAIRVIKLVMDNQTLGQAIDQAKQELKTVRPQIANDKSPTTNRRPNPATATTTTTSC